MTSFNQLTTILSQKSLDRSNYISIAEEIGSLNVLEVCLVENYIDRWIIDLGATNHVCYSLKRFKQNSPLSKGHKLGNGEYVSTMAVGLVEVCFIIKIYVHQIVYLFRILRGIWFMLVV